MIVSAEDTLLICSPTVCWSLGVSRPSQEEVSKALTTTKTQAVFEQASTFIPEVVANCSSNRTSLAPLDRIPVEEFARPFIIAQESGSTRIRMKDGSLLVLLDTDASEVYDSLITRSQQSQKAWSVYSKNILTVYMNQYDAFLAFNCSPCSDGESRHQSFGIYPDLFRWGKGVIQDATAQYIANSYPAAIFHIDDDQALAVMEKLQAERANPKYMVHNNNGADFVMRFGPAIGEHRIVDFLPPLDSVNILNSIPHTYTVLKYQSRANQDQVSFGLAILGFVYVYATAKIFSKISRLFSKDKIPPKPSLPLKMQKAKLLQTGFALAVRTIIGSQHTQFMQFIRLASLGMPAKFVLEELQSQEPLDLNKRPSFFNRRVSFQLSGIAFGIIGQIVVKATEIITRRESSPSAQNAQLVVSVFGSCMRGLNVLRNTWNDITAAPCLDDVDLR